MKIFKIEAFFFFFNFFSNKHKLSFYHTNPYNSDTDGDQLCDGFEIYVSNSDPLNEDTDQDGISDYEEVIFETKPWAKWNEEEWQRKSRGVTLMGQAPENDR